MWMMTTKISRNALSGWRWIAETALLVFLEVSRQVNPMKRSPQVAVLCAQGMPLWNDIFSELPLAKRVGPLPLAGGRKAVWSVN